MNDTVRSIIHVKGFIDFEMDFQLLRQLGSASYGGGSIGESLLVVSKMKSENAEEWVKNFYNLALRQENDARQRLNKNHYISSAEQFLKASNSYRAAEYFLHSSNPEHKIVGLKSQDCFLKYLELTYFHYKADFIEFNGLKLPYYFIAPNSSKKKRKTIIIISGFDGTREESFIQSGLAALKHGYNVVCFAGPGQMDSLRFNENSYFQPDFNKSITKLLDKLENNTAIDFTRIALLGLSFGGYFASQTCCYESRIKALIANSPIIDLKKYVLGFSSESIDETNSNPEDDFTYSDIPNIPDEIMPPSFKEMVSNLLLRFGNKSMFETLKYLNSFNILDDFRNIQLPVLALIGEGEGVEPLSQYKQFIEGVKNASYYKFSVEDGADTHCQVTNLGFSNCVIYDWLDEILIS